MQMRIITCMVQPPTTQTTDPSPAINKEGLPARLLAYNRNV